MITEKEVIHCAELARLQLTTEEIKLFTKQLDKILDYVAKINELDVKDVQPTAHILPINNIMRSDDSQSESLAVENVIEMAPESDDNFFVVPKVI